MCTHHFPTFPNPYQQDFAEEARLRYIDLQIRALEEERRQILARQNARRFPYIPQPWPMTPPFSPQPIVYKKPIDIDEIIKKIPPKKD